MGSRNKRTGGAEEERKEEIDAEEEGIKGIKNTELAP